MTRNCVHCLKLFDGRPGSDFCSDEHKKAFDVELIAEARHKREVARSGAGHLAGARYVGGGRQAINWGLSDYRRR